MAGLGTVAPEYTLRALIDRVPDYLFIKDTDSRFVLANPAVAEDLGLAVEDLIGKTDFDLHPHERAEKFRADEQEIIRSGEPIIDTEDLVFTASGQKKWMSTSKLPLRDPAGEIIGIVGICRDISERKVAEDALIASETQLSDALKIARAAHWTYDVAQDAFTFNDAFYALYHTTAEEVGGYVMAAAEYAGRFCHPDDMEIVGREVAGAINAKDPNYSVEIEHRVIFGDGRTGWVAVRFFIVKDEAGRTVSTYGVNRDITERKLSEAALVESESRWNSAPLSRINATTLESLAMCPMNWFFAQILGLSEAELASWELSPSGEGEWVHETMARFFEPSQYSEHWDESQIRGRLMSCLHEAKEHLIQTGGMGHPSIWAGRQAVLEASLLRSRRRNWRACPRPGPGGWKSALAETGPTPGSCCRLRGPSWSSPDAWTGWTPRRARSG